VATGPSISPSDPPTCSRGDSGKAQCTIEVAHDDFKAMLGNPQVGMQLYFQGKLKVSGDPMLATKLHAVPDAAGVDAARTAARRDSRPGPEPAAPRPFLTMVLATSAPTSSRSRTLARRLHARHPAAQGRFRRRFLAVNRHKRSLALDLKSPAGREAFLKMCEKADVVVESFRPG
jgi:hypothetical protein